MPVPKRELITDHKTYENELAAILKSDPSMAWSEQELKERLGAKSLILTTYKCIKSGVDVRLMRSGGQLYYYLGDGNE